MSEEGAVCGEQEKQIGSKNSSHLDERTGLVRTAVVRAVGLKVNTETPFSPDSTVVHGAAGRKERQVRTLARQARGQEGQIGKRTVLSLCQPRCDPRDEYALS